MNNRYLLLTDTSRGAAPTDAILSCAPALEPLAAAIGIHRPLGLPRLSFRGRPTALQAAEIFDTETLQVVAKFDLGLGAWIFPDRPSAETLTRPMADRAA